MPPGTHGLGSPHAAAGQCVACSGEVLGLLQGHGHRPRCPPCWVGGDAQMFPWYLVVAGAGSADDLSCGTFFPETAGFSLGWDVGP